MNTLFLALYVYYFCILFFCEYKLKVTCLLCRQHHNADSQVRRNHILSPSINSNNTITAIGTTNIKTERSAVVTFVFYTERFKS